MANSVCYQCQKRTTPKTCESSCPERQAELMRQDAIRHQRYLDGIENDSVRLKRINSKNMHDKKAGRKK